MTYSMMRFAAYDWAKGVVHTDLTTPIPGYKMALAGSMAGGIAGFLGNPAELVMVRMQADKAKPVERGSFFCLLREGLILALGRGLIM
jgi:dicarboxylate transporter 10